MGVLETPNCGFETQERGLCNGLTEGGPFYKSGGIDRDFPGDGVCSFYVVGSKSLVDRGSGYNRSQSSGFLVSCALWHGLRPPVAASKHKLSFASSWEKQLPYSHFASCRI